MQCSVINIFWSLWTTFDGYILLSAAIYYFRCPYATSVDLILLSTAIYHFWRLYTTFEDYILLSTVIYYFQLYVTVTYCTVFPAICFLCGLNTRLEFNINLLALIQFSFFCNSMVSPVKFNLLFWKRCFIRNTQMLKMWNFQALKKRT